MKKIAEIKEWCMNNRIITAALIGIALFFAVSAMESGGG